ncbi:MAG: ABC transporter substrate-binding protein [Geminicoccaceae bacterium]|nr:ABC transporter substrate-binding protein [Geminicoccaceae bacterium]HRY24561.1 ABC transporter substrate-binding protein [Geminicoccaceae bacterium]
MRMKTLALALAAGLAAVASTSVAQEPIVIGLSAPLTGDYAEYGNNFKRAIDLHVEQINAAGGVAGRPLEIVESDDRSDSAQTTAIAQRYVNDPEILAVIGSFASTPSMAAAPIYQRAGVVQLCPSCSHPDYTKIGEFMFRNTTTQQIEAPAIADFVVEDLGAKTIMVVHRQDDWGLSASGNFIARAEELGAEIVANEAFLETERDFRPVITQLRSLDPDVLHVAMFFTEAAILAQQLQAAGIDIPVVTTTSMFNPQYIVLGGEAVEGHIVPATFFPGNPDPNVQAFVEEYEGRYDIAADSFAAIAYDSVGILAAAIEHVAGQGQEVTRAAIQKAMFEMEPYAGVSGVAAFNEVGDVVKEITWLTIENGEFTVLER